MDSSQCAAINDRLNDDDNASVHVSRFVRWDLVVLVRSRRRLLRSDEVVDDDDDDFKELFKENSFIGSRLGEKEVEETSGREPVVVVTQPSRTVEEFLPV